MMSGLKESTRVWILQMALDKVRRGIEPTEPMTKAEKESYDLNVAYLKKYLKEVGPEKFDSTVFDVGYDMCDDEDYDDED